MKIQEKQAQIKETLIDPKATKQFEDLLTDVSKEENKALEVADAFTDHGDEVLDAIKIGLTTKIAQKSEEENYNNHILAKEAFNEDIKKAQENLKLEKESILNNKITTEQNTNDDIYGGTNENIGRKLNKYDKKEKQLNKLLKIVAEIENLIPGEKDKINKEKTEKETEAKTQVETRNLETLLNVTPTLEIAQELFETNEKAWNAIATTNEKRTETEKTNFKTLLEHYGKAAGMTTVTGYKFKNDSKSGESKYNYIKITGTGTPAEQDIMRGKSTDVLHNARSELNKGTREKKTIADNLEALDGIGSYREFEDILAGKGTEATKFLRDLLGEGLLEGISTYKSKSGDIDTKNRYYGVILDYIIGQKDELLLKTYLKNVVVGEKVNLQYLGTDRENQVANFNKIANKRSIDKDSDNGKTLTKIRLQLAENMDKQSFQEAAKSGVDSFFKAYGDIIIDILEFFGGKGSARKFFMGTLGMSEEKFNEYFKVLNEKYKKRYGLDEAQKKILKDDLYDAYNTATDKKENEELTIGTSGIKIPYDPTTVITLARKTFIGDKFKHLDPELVAKAAKELNIADVVTKENKDGRITKKINDDVSPTNKEAIVDYLLKGEKGGNTGSVALWKEVATAANTIMNTKKIYGQIEAKAGKGLTAENIARNNEQIANREKKGIKNGADIALFVGAYMMKGSDNLAYTITETDELENENTPIPASEIIKTGETLAFKDETINFTDQKINTAGAGKMIHEIIDMDTAPAEIIITRKDGTTVVNCTLKEDYTDSQITTATPTYIDDTEKRVKIYVGDKIETFKTPEELYTESMKKINEQQEYISNGKYKSFDFTDFTYNKNADADQKQYQENILTPLANIITNEEQYKIFVTEINLKKIKDNSIKHIANTFTMIDNKNNPKKYNEITGNIENTVTSIEAKNDVITITQDTGTITIKYNAGKLETERTEKKVS